ncbi:MAG: AAA family ATPase [Thiofilum sp.]|uniref:AAA family ATPase n=1 Tax=Thiofilum sp. TaxID=2212733 RepID=UPI0025E383D2|nr:AAA family ATPase [Thiofilum sp.]MBK8453442.1 AAA family ATPase [Thiofilum sp.]
MRIRAIHTYEFGALGTQSFDFRDSWSDETATRILLSGANGCGKSTLLRGIAMLWSAFGYWLHNRKHLPEKSVERRFLSMGGGFAIVVENLPFAETKSLLLAFGEGHWSTNPALVKPDYIALGEGSGFGRIYFHPSDYDPFLNNWTRARQKMLVSPQPSESPNILFLDAEERRWVTPKYGLGEIKAENMEQRWLSSYRATENWDGQVESALLGMKIASEERFSKLVDNMNSFLSGKEILKEVILGENRLRIQLANGSTHGIDELSSGEHQVLIQLYMVDRWMERGGIVMIDEPDLYLHPSLISGFLAQLENMVAERDGQLIITSHVPDVWSRYEAIGQRVLLGMESQT